MMQTNDGAGGSSLKRGRNIASQVKMQDNASPPLKVSRKHPQITPQALPLYMREDNAAPH
jgi:hypothetical protein